ncbi:hypothetical protein [Serratia liquefaciens]|uniref:hypothetical protein n=1 Tax=Serratia liquefaciens TaxID=614 RepID=UPI00236078A7|nr:hypothetical protein [Serratia liquefaciens]
MNIPFSFRTMAIGLLLVALIVAGRLAFYFHGNAVKAGEQVKQQEKTLAQQAGVIATLQTQDVQNRVLMAAQQQQEQQLRQQADIYQRKYREAIKNDECARRTAPGAVLDLMHQSDGTATSADHPVTP